MKNLYLTGYKPFLKQINEFENSVFLGPWCFRNNTVLRFEDQRQYNIIPSPYKSWEEILQISIRIDKLTDRVIHKLGIMLNSHLQQDLSELFWRRLYVNRVLHLLGIFYDRYLCLCQLKDHDLQILIQNIDEHESFELYDMSLFYRSHLANLFLFSHMIRTVKDFQVFNTLKVECEFSFDEELKLKKQNRKINLNTIKESLDLFINYNPNVYLGTVYGLNILDRLSLQGQCLGFGSLLQNLSRNLFRKKKFGSGEQEFVPRKKIGLNVENEFEEWVDTYILNFLEVPSSDQISKAFETRMKVWIGADYAKYPLEIATSSEKKGKWISVQHGGGYGQFLSFPIGKIEYENSDEFLSWGWENNHIYETNNIKALAAPIISKIHNTGNKNAKREIMLLSTTHPAYLYRLHSTLLPHHQLPYLETKIGFLNNLESHIREKVFYRPYPDEFTQVEKRIFKKINIKFDTDTYLIKENLYKKYRLVVVDHLATSYLHTFIMNIPTIIFFRREHFEYCKEAEPDFKKLIEAEILFHDEALAAKKVNEIYSDPNKWWNSENVQKAKNEFCFMYARPSLDWKKDWVQYIQAKLNDATN